MKTRNVVSIKVAAAAATASGLVFGIFSPEFITTEKPSAPEWVGWTAWIFTAVGAIIYIAIDFLSSRKPPEA
jgi:hypothetical protein